MSKAIEFLESEFAKLGTDAKIKQDTGWDKGSYGGRCITDYSREIIFSRELTSEELKTVKDIMAREHCPGWTGVNGYCTDKETLLYRFSTTWDSSD